MTEREFKGIIDRARRGDLMAIEKILALYEPMINKHSYALGKIDEDLRQYIILRIITGIRVFKA